METLITILTGYGPLGCWVVFSIVREKALIKRLEDQARRFESERIRWDRERTRWMRTLGRKMSDQTIIETLEDR